MSQMLQQDPADVMPFVWSHFLWTPWHYHKFSACNVISKFSERVYIIYFIALKTWVNFVHRQKTTVTTRSLTVNKNRNEQVHIKKQWIKPWRAHHVNETDKSTQYCKAMQQWQPQKMFIVMLKWSSADERALSDILVYKNKHVSCFILIIYPLKYMFCY